MEELVAQAQELAEKGVKELILVAQETTVYGVDLYGKKSLHLSCGSCQDQRASLDSSALLLSGGNFWIKLIETVRDKRKGMSSGSPDSACKRCGLETNGTQNDAGRSQGDYCKDSQRDSGYRAAYHADRRFPGRDAGAA